MLGILPKGKLARKEALWFWFFVSPFIIGFILFTGGPILASAYLSFTQYNIASPPQWIGLQNYERLVADEIFWKSLQVSAYYTFLSVPLGIIASLSVAIILNQKIPLQGFLRTMYYLPSVVTGVALALLFQWLLNPSFGIVNYFFLSLVGPNGIIPLGLEAPRWFFDPNWVIPGFVLLSLWGLGAPMLIYLAGLQGVPSALYEAALIDGANAWQRLRNVTLPMISPVILFTFITGIIGSFQVFTQAYIISGGTGGPNYASMFYVLYLYLNAFRRYRMGYASAQAWILFIIVLVLTIIALRWSRRAVHYEGQQDGDAI
jgi:multiple sugar transport system permease protein